MELGFKIYFDTKMVYVCADELKGLSQGDTTIYKANIDGIDIEWTHTSFMGGLIVDMDLRSSAPLGIKRIDSVVYNAGIPAPKDHIAVIGRDSIRNEIRFGDEFGVNTEYCETVMGLFEHLDSKGVIVAGVSPFKNICNAVAKKSTDGSFTFCVKTEYTDGAMAQTQLKTERAYINDNISINDFYSLYRRLLPQSSFDMPKLVGWNTWDYYLDRVSATDVFENVAALKNMPFADQIDYIVIDDGWQKDWGDWTENDKFGCGLKAVADDIITAGFIPGIWMTPVGIHDDVSIFTEHSDWLCRNEKGELLKLMGLYYIDPTHPDAREFILNNYRYQYQCGFRLFKMDYVSPLLQVKDFYDKNATPYEMLSQLVKDVKAVTGPDAVVLGCSLPLECGADISPSMRIGLDIHNHFSHVKAISRSIAWSSVFNNKVTRIDPDFLIVRGEQTSTEPLIWEDGGKNDFVAPPRAEQTDKDRRKIVWRHGDQFNAIEAQTWANIVAVSGGNIFLSDRMSVLNERAIKIIDDAFKIAGDNVKPVYLHDDYRQPSLWLGDKALVLVNWEDTERTITVNNITKKLVSKKTFLHTNNTLIVTLRPHESFAAIYKD